MEIVYKETAIEDKEFWKKSGNKQVLKKIEELIKDILLHPENGYRKTGRIKI